MTLSFAPFLNDEENPKRFAAAAPISDAPVVFNLRIYSCNMSICSFTKLYLIILQKIEVLDIKYLSPLVCF
jgi:hypothetical protein